MTSLVLGDDVIGKALQKISQSSFSKEIEKTNLPCRFARPTFTIYDSKTDPMEHISHYNQSMAIYSKNKALLCKIFPSKLLCDGLMGWKKDLFGAMMS